MVGKPKRVVLPHWLTPSVAALLLANLVPVGGVLWLGWEVGDVVLLYWVENLIVGGFNIVRMLVVRMREPAAWLGKLVLVPFFAVHYGGFAAVHGVLLTAMFKTQGANLVGVLDGNEVDSVGMLVPLLIAGTLLQALSQRAIAYGALTLVASHGLSFVLHDLVAGESDSKTLQELMLRPYRRVILLHVVVIGSGFLLLLTGSPISGLMLMVALKVALDVSAHRREHTTT